MKSCFQFIAALWLHCDQCYEEFVKVQKQSSIISQQTESVEQATYLGFVEDQAILEEVYVERFETPI